MRRVPVDPAAFEVCFREEIELGTPSASSA